MHFEILVEDQSGGIVLKQIMEQTLGQDKQANSYKINPYKGIGHIPKDLMPKTDPSKRILLDQLPKLLRGYGERFQKLRHVVIVVVDLDRRDCRNFKNELLSVLSACNPAPKAFFRIAIEEIEAWLLGDRDAVVSAYPKAKRSILTTYRQDSICGTWEKLAEAVDPKEYKICKKQGYPRTDKMKCELARKIAPHMNIQANESRSFQVFRDKIIELKDAVNPNP